MFISIKLSFKNCMSGDMSGDMKVTGKLNLCLREGGFVSTLGGEQ